MASSARPGAARDIAGFVRELRRLKLDAGDPSFHRLSRVSGVPASTLHDALRPDRAQLPRLEVVLRFVEACGLTPAAAARWEAAWREIREGRRRSPAAAPTDATTSGPVPRQLPGRVFAFTGRERELAAMDAIADDCDGARILLVSGCGGVGKTTLAVQWAHRALERAPDGQVYVNLRGFDTEQPVEPMTALGRMLPCLLPPGSPLPQDLDGRSALWRSATAGRRLLIVVDNAANAAQVRPLLPGGSGCVVVVTSRAPLGGLVAREGARRVDLLPLPVDDSVLLLERLIGPRAVIEPDAIRRLAEHCARLPLALRLGAEAAIARGGDTLGELLAEFDDASALQLIDDPSDPQASIEAVLMSSLRGQPDEVVRSFVLLGVQPGADLSLQAAGALLDLGSAPLRRRIEQLVRLHLLAEPMAGRFTMHDLLRAAASRRASTVVAERGAAIERLVGYYVERTAEASALLQAGEPSSDEMSERAALRFGGSDGAVRWLDAERANMLGCAAHVEVLGLPQLAIRLAEALYRYLSVRGHLHELKTLYAIALRCARASGDRLWEARSLAILGRAEMQLGRVDEGLQTVHEADRLFRDLGVAEASSAHLSVLTWLGVGYLQTGRMPLAHRYFSEACEIADRGADAWLIGMVHQNLGFVCAELEDYDAAIGHAMQALDWYSRAGGHAGGETGVWDNLGNVYLRTGRPELAISALERAIDIAARAGMAYDECIARISMGNALLMANRAEDAVTQFEQALEFAEAGGVADETAKASEGLRRALTAQQGRTSPRP